MQTQQTYNDFIYSDPYFGELVMTCFPNPEKEFEGKTVVDVGCGNGLMSIFFALNGAEVTGVDIDDDVLCQANQRADEWGVADRCRFVRANAESLPFADESADVVFSRSTLQYVDRQRAIPHYYRILKPGGALVLIENLPYNPFIRLFRAKRWLTASSERETVYLNSIRGYVSFGELTTYATWFRTSQHHYLHLSRVVWVFLQTNPKMANGPVAQWLNKFTERIDNWLLINVPSSRRAAWYVGFVGIGKVQSTESGNSVSEIS